MVDGLRLDERKERARREPGAGEEMDMSAAREAATKIIRCHR
jgi:hypothetical protein